MQRQAFKIQFLTFIYQYQYPTPQMTNPFELLNVSDDEEQTIVVQTKGEDKVKRTHQEKKLYKKQQEAQNNNQPSTINEPIPEKIKESHITPRMERNKREYKAKELTSGHYHDRQSGTGRQDRPRKAGGGYGNVGNVKDQQNRQKYVKENEEVKAESTQNATEGQVEVPAVEEKAPEPQKLTLQEYYKAKGVDLAYTAQSKGPAKKSDINAEWIKKEKLTLVQTKEELKNQQRNNQQALKRNEGKAGLDIDEADYGKLGFGAKPAASKPVARQQPRHEEQRKGGKRNNKPAFSTEDFPTL